jgi:hypothetical protein
MSISITAVDPGGSTVPYSGPISLNEVTSYGDGRISPATVTLSGGTWSGSVTMYRADQTSINRGNVNVVAYLAADPSINGTSDPFTVHPGPFNRLQVIAPGQDPLPGSVAGLLGSPASQTAAVAFSVDVYATDAYWNPLSSGDNVRITSSDPGSTPVTGALSNGFRSFTFTLNTVGTQTLTVNDQSNGSIQSMTSAGIMVMASGAHHFEFDAITGPVTAGQAVPVTVRATDAGGNTVPGYAGNAILIANTGPGSISPEAIVFNNVILAFVISLAVMLGVLEVGLRLLGQGPGRKINQPDSQVGWVKRPDFSFRRRTPEFDVTLETNALGLRDDPMESPAKPPGTFRVLCLGDSFVLGYAVPRKDLFVDVLERWWRAEGRQVEVINAGTEGYSTDQEAAWFAAHGADFDPDLVLLFPYENDIWWNGRTDYLGTPKPRYDSSGNLEGVPLAAPSFLSKLAVGRLLQGKPQPDFLEVGEHRVLADFAPLLREAPPGLGDAEARTGGALKA